MKVIHLDVSDLEPPEPYRLAIDILSTLPPNVVFKMTHRQEPFPLYQTATEMGFDYHATEASPNVIHIRFWHKGNEDMAKRSLNGSEMS